MEMEMEPVSPMTATMTALELEEPGSSSMVRTIPAGFEACPHNHVCPSCSSSLILKQPPDERAIKTKSSSFSATAAALENVDPDIQGLVRGNLESSLNSAHSANLLLQALSFDAATREEKQGLEFDHLAAGVSFCPECKVHVITSAEELERLFDEYENENEEGSMEWLRGSLLVSVDDAEIFALQSCRGGKPATNEQPESKPVFIPPKQTYQPESQPLQSQLGEQNVRSQTSQSNIGQQSLNSQPTQQSQPILGQPSMISEAISAYNTLPRHLKPKPTRPVEFDYEYRHKVATQAMASRIGRGYSLLEEICSECEMPLMKLREKKECVVCPKLLKKIAKYHASNEQQPNDASHDPQDAQQRSQQEVDPISAIIAEARSEAPHQSDKTRRITTPAIAEAKQYVMQRRIMTTELESPKRDSTQKSAKSSRVAGQALVGCNASEAGSNGTESMTDHTNSTAGDNSGDMMQNPINWEELLINGRAILSKRLNEGWTLSSANCLGVHCKGTPLLQQSDGGFVNLDYCTVCGGSGNGEDGAYERELEWEAKAAELAERAEREARPNWEELAGNGRALLAERLKQGWTMSSENCEGYHCNQMPLTNIEDGPNSCVVCGGTGNGCDGAYENYKPEELVEEERALVSQEISQLMTMGWVLREALCVRCFMPLVAEADEAPENLCILCGLLEENQMLETSAENNCDVLQDNDNVEYDEEIIDEGNVEAHFEADVQDDEEADVDDSYINDSYLNEEPYVSETLIGALNEPVAIFGDDNTDDAGRKLIAGWTLPDAGLCHHCYGIQMSPPNSNQIGCINRGCPSALAAAYTLLPEPHESTGPVKLIGRGFSNPYEKEEEAQEAQIEQELINDHVEEEVDGHMSKPQIQSEVHHHHHGNARCTIEEQCEYDGPPLEIFGRKRGPGNAHHYDEPSVLSDDLSQVRSVASSALGIILVRLDDAKYELEEMIEGGEADPHQCAEKQVEIAMLIEKLANAAVQMKQMEEG